jgi:ubiquinone/menaquinone biosynthesis methyltransferase
MGSADGANAAHFHANADDVFARIAGRYDVLCDLFSFWIHRHWKRKVAALIGTSDWRRMLDSASGTGDIVLRVVREMPDREGRDIIASDISPAMLDIARRKLDGCAFVQIRELDAHSMPSIPDGSIDLYSISLGLKICDRNLALREALRVLRPGGTLVALEASNIPWGWLQRLYLAYMGLCMPVLGWLATAGDASAYRYLLQGIKEFPTAEALAAEMSGLGFESVSFERLSLGIVAIHRARKPDPLTDES